MAIEIYGKLKSEETYIPLDISVSEKETIEIHNEYRNVFGDEIEFFERKMSKQEYAEAKNKAIVKLFTALNGPITNVFLNISKN